MEFGILTLPALIASAFFGIAVLKQADPLVVYPVPVPPALEEQGYTGKVVANRLTAEIGSITEQARTLRDTRDFAVVDEETPVEAIGDYFELLAPVHAIQEYWGRVNFSFSADVVRVGDGYQMNMAGKNNRTLHAFRSSVAANDPQSLIHTAAIEMMRFMDPYVVASYTYETTRAAGGTDYSATLRELRNCMGVIPDTDWHWIHNLWGLVLFRQGNPDAAIERYQQALRIRPGFVLAVYNWGDALLAKGDAAGAIEKYAEVIALDQATNFRTPQALTHWGMALRALNRPQEAEAMLRRAIAADRAYADAYNALGELLRDRSDIAGARDAFEHAAALEPTRREFAANLSGLAH